MSIILNGCIPKDYTEGLQTMECIKMNIHWSYYLLVALVITGYLLLVWLHGRRLMHPEQAGKIGFLQVFGLGVLAGHAVLLSSWVYLAIGYSLYTGSPHVGLLTVFSQMTWLCALLVWLLSVRTGQSHLQILTSLLAGISIPLALFVPDGGTMALPSHPQEIIHILLAMLSLGVVFLATLQSILVVLNERVLRNTRFARYLHVFSPLASMETFLFQLIWLGFILLTLLLLSSLYVFHDLWSAHLFSKTLISIATWLVFAGLLFGRYLFGWRGLMATRFTLLGMLLLGCLMVFSLNYSGLS
jgi:ABC-type uncharacterized transport system permease subunit